MKYCQHCGTQLCDEAVVCINCGCAVQTMSANNQPATQNEPSTLKTIAKIFMLIGCIMSACYLLIPLCWTIPMTVHYWKAVENKQPVSTGFKVCSLLFVSLIGGVLMLCDNKDFEESF